MEKLNPVRSFLVKNLREKMKSRIFTQVQCYSEAKTIFLERGRDFFLYNFFIFNFSHELCKFFKGKYILQFEFCYMESTCTVCISPK